MCCGFKMKRVLIVLAKLLAFVAAFDECSLPDRLMFHTDGNITISGIFDMHHDDNCSVPLGKGLEEAAAAVWTVSILNQLNYIPGVQIGLSIYDACDLPEEAKKTLVKAMVYQNCMKNAAKSAGTVASASITATLEPLASGLNISLAQIGNLLDQATLTDIMIMFLREMAFNTVHRVIAEDTTWLDAFGRATANNGICVYDQVLLDDIHAINNDVLQPPEDTANELHTDGNLVIVVFASSSNISTLMRRMDEGFRTKTDILWLIVPIDLFLKIEPGILPRNSYILTAVTPKDELLESFLKRREVTTDPLNHREPLKSPFFLNIASKVLAILQPFKQTQLEFCGESNDTCTEFDDYFRNITPISDRLANFLTAESVSDVLAVTRVPVEQEMFLVAVAREEATEDFAVFRIFNHETSKLRPALLLIRDSRRKRAIVRLRLEDITHRNNSKEALRSEMNIRQKTEEKHVCYESTGNITEGCGICLNFVKYLSKIAHEKQTTDFNDIEISWRFETWVGVNAAIASIGTLCCVAISIFIIVRICVGDVLEGSAVFTFFLLFAVILTYISTIPFSLISSGEVGDKTLSSLICDLRMSMPPVTYSILLSLMFSRSLMLASSDQDGGFMSHVNGYLQAVLIFFVNGIQFVISSEYWIFNSFLFNSSTSCQAMYNNHRFVLLHSYNILLLVLLLSVIPFMFKSKRNYREGATFSVAIVIILCVWGIWIPLLYFFPQAYNDIVVTFGLTSTASTILISVFIPRTFLMTTSLVRDRIVNTLPPLSNSSGTFNSSQALYDPSVTISAKVGTSNPNFYAINPTPDSVPATPKICPGEYYSSQNEIKVPTPQRTMSRIRCETPEHTYEGCDSPYHGPKNITRF